VKWFAHNDSDDCLPNEVLRGNDTGGDSVSESVQLDGLVSFQVLFAQEDVEVGLLLDRDIDLVGVLWAAAWGRLSSSLSFSAFFHS